MHKQYETVINVQVLIIAELKLDKMADKANDKPVSKKEEGKSEHRKLLIIKTLPTSPATVEAHSTRNITCRTARDLSGSSSVSNILSRSIPRICRKAKTSSGNNIIQKPEPVSICNIPSIPSNQRKYGYLETGEGMLFPLVDAIRYFRNGNVLLTYHFV